MESAPLPSACTTAESEIPTPLAGPTPRFVPPVPENVIAPLESTWVDPLIPTPVTEFEPVAFEVPPVPPIEMAPPFNDSIRLDATIITPRAVPVADVPPVPTMLIEPTPERTE